MRLIDVNTLKLHEFVGPWLVPGSYAILSHTWGEDEVTFQDIQNLDESVRSKTGFSKIFHAAKQAKQDGYTWLWVDTCCIDKTSSAELSEAINSMYDWYRQSEVCYAHLADVNGNPTESLDSRREFRESRWFTRGWTLQELIGPNYIKFYDKNWRRIGEKDRRPQANVVLEIWDGRGKVLLCEASRVPYDVLFNGGVSTAMYSVAQRMSWASNRTCTRIEDTAYSLLGLFDINMPLLYGEGYRAFARLQEEIIKSTDDHSIFAWTIPRQVLLRGSLDGAVLYIDWTPHPVLAPSPQYFAGGGSVVLTKREDGEPSGLTKHGLRIDLLLDRYTPPPAPTDVLYRNAKTMWAPLNCTLTGLDNTPLAIFLVEISSSFAVRGARRTHCYRVGTTQHLRFKLSARSRLVDKQSIDNSLTTLYIRQKEAGLRDGENYIQFAHIPVRLPVLGSASLRLNGSSFSEESGERTTPSPGFTVHVCDEFLRFAWSTVLGCGPMQTPAKGNKFHVFALGWKSRSPFLLLAVKPTTTAGLEVLTALYSPSLDDPWKGYDKTSEKWLQREPEIYTSFPCSLPNVQLGKRVLRTRIESTMIDLKVSPPVVARRMFTVFFEEV
ncbi:heterokaryon incompatibility protein-domain-containing protein [Podospora aff. communis PSN243]|uniref:Heterokaryon incompatibility protein-domain-containing protein n=1 Tax=Podospora aff. communis PSN243 TaxID=3040156 RepID=A0AAV9GTF6_9PEZI|nr:heterokaryon incompatibility protein-domain-containing protein [Podospora aff. communis PSN243]